MILDFDALIHFQPIRILKSNNKAMCFDLSGGSSQFLLVLLTSLAKTWTLTEPRTSVVVFSLSTGFITLLNPTPALMNSLNSCCPSVIDLRGPPRGSGIGGGYIGKRLVSF